MVQLQFEQQTLNPSIHYDIQPPTRQAQRAATQVPDRTQSVTANAMPDLFEITDESPTECVAACGTHLPDNDDPIALLIPPETAYVATDAFVGARLVSVTTPPGVTAIGGSAFKSCKLLTKVTLSVGLSSIGWAAFEGCITLESIVLPPGLVHLRGRCFMNCRRLSNVELPKELTQIGGGVFRGCTSLQSINLPPNVEDIGSAAFLGCSSLEEIDIPHTIVRIWDNTFDGCQNLVLVTFPPNLQAIDSCAFRGCCRLEAAILPEGLTTIGLSAFADCNSLNHLVLPSTLKQIMNFAFIRARCLRLIVIPDAVESIGGAAFRHSGLVSIDGEGGALALGSEAFADCRWLVTVRLARHGIKSTCVAGDTNPFARCPNLLHVIAPHFCVIADCDWQAVNDTPTTRFRAVSLQYWSLATHHACMPTWRAWVRAVMLCATRLRRQDSCLPIEMWFIILSLIRRWELGPAE